MAGSVALSTAQLEPELWPAADSPQLTKSSRAISQAVLCERTDNDGPGTGLDLGANRSQFKMDYILMP